MNIEAFIAHINASQQHRYLYHFTDEANFTTIAQKGLLSKEQMRAQGWWPAATGGNELSHSLDDLRGISRYVSLCFTRNHPMKFVANQGGRLPSPKYLGISAEILRVPGVRVSFDVANKNGARIMDLAEAIPQIDREVIYSRTDWKDPAIRARLSTAEKMEVLVPDQVPVELIKVIF